MFLIRHAQASFLEGNYDKLSNCWRTAKELSNVFRGRDWEVAGRGDSSPGRAILGRLLRTSRSWTFPSCLKQESRGASCDLQLRRTDWSGHAARFESFATRHPPRGLDVSKLFLQRVPVLRRSFYAEHI